jgi:hypothetical protein
MKLLHKVPVDDVKRCFVYSELLRPSKNKSTINRKILSSISKICGKSLDSMVSKNYPKRIKAYNSCDWYLATFLPKELGVWRRAGGLPLEWTNGSLADTAKYFRIALGRNSFKSKKIRAAKIIPDIIRELSSVNIQSNKYLLPIVFKHGFGTRGRRYLKYSVKGDIDDGCMRSIALVLNGVKKIKVYYGIPN